MSSTEAAGQPDVELTPDTDIQSLPVNEQLELKGETEDQIQGHLDEESEVCVADGQEEEGSEEQQTSDQVWDFLSVGTWGVLHHTAHLCEHTYPLI